MPSPIEHRSYPVGLWSALSFLCRRTSEGSASWAADVGRETIHFFPLGPDFFCLGEFAHFKSKPGQHQCVLANSSPGISIPIAPGEERSVGQDEGEQVASGADCHLLKSIHR